MGRDFRLLFRELVILWGCEYQDPGIAQTRQFSCVFWSGSIERISIHFPCKSRRLIAK
jgi:hypothetical protein